MRTPSPFVFVIFGASGDLTVRKLIPAVYALFCLGNLPERFSILGISRSAMSDEQFREKMKTGIGQFNTSPFHTPEKTEAFLLHLHYQALDTTNPAEYALLSKRLQIIENENHIGQNYIYYLATPPSLYATIAHSLREQNLHCENNECSGFRRIIVEKPFGYDLQTSKELNHRLHEVFQEDQIYRIDHYLGKETVQNILVSRFSNVIFEPLWNHHYIHHIEITSAESIGVENRGGYYEEAGALRDMLQNHLLQLVALVAMEPPAIAESNLIRNETLKVFQSFRPLKPEDIANHIIRGQYTASHIRGEKMNGYRDETGVAPDSKTETYVAMKFFIDNWRWSGVPFYIRTGKRLPTRVTEIVIHFRQTAHHLFQMNRQPAAATNQLIIRIQPDEGLLLKFGMKVPGSGFNVQNVNMDFHYTDLADTYQPSAYERLLHDSMIGDSTLFQRGDAVEATWQFINPVLERWKNDPSIPVYGYPSGSWGPECADNLFAEKNHTWRYPCKNLADDGIYCEL